MRRSKSTISSFNYDIIKSAFTISMAVFRSAESRIPTIRSTASGVTCYVDSTGRVVEEANAFIKEQVSLIKKQVGVPNKLFVSLLPIFS